MSTPSTTKTIFLDKKGKEKTLEFDALRLKLASPEEILSWSYGEVTKPETINYRSQRPERDGLFCQKIFGPIKDWQCACGKYKGIRYRNVICDRCGVKVTRSIVRRERMGHIKLAAPITHIWFLRGVPSKIGLLLDLSIKSLEKIVYFNNFIITSVNEELKEKELNKAKEEFKEEKLKLKKEITDKEELEKRINLLTEKFNLVKKEIDSLVVKRILTENEYRDNSLKYGHIFEANIGAEAILKLLEDLNLQAFIKSLRLARKKIISLQLKEKITARIRLAQNFLTSGIKPSSMVLRVLPVIPPDLRPLVELDGGRFASSDLNDLYRRVINRNNRLKRLYELQAPEVIIRNEKRMLQEAVDALLDNTMRRGKTTVLQGGQKRPLKSLADILKGKEGRFRRNLLGKRVDYSARSVIVAGPYLKMNQCGLPKMIALEMYKPFVASELIKREIVHNVKSANRKIDDGDPEVWDILEEIISNSYVLLNRAPTLHRLSIQAFQPILIEGKAISIHPLVCPAFNADFDGDQMAVHLPISKKARQEAKEIMSATKNLLKPANGQPIVLPIQDIILGIYYLTIIPKKEKNLKSFINKKEAIIAYELGKIGLQQEIRAKVEGKIYQTSVGRLIFGEIFPLEFYQLDRPVDKKLLNSLITDYLEIYGQEATVNMLDELKEIAFKYLTKSGLSWGMDDLPLIEEKKEIIAEAEKEVAKTNQNFRDGLLVEKERHLKNIEIWSTAKNKIQEIAQQKLDHYSSPFLMVNSGSRGNWSQLIQMVGIRGLVASPSGEIIELPICSSYREGLDVLEYFISTHGSRKGVVDTALRTAKAGYLTRRLVDAAQEVLVTEDDCHTDEGIWFTRQDNEFLGQKWSERIFGRVAAGDIKNPQTNEIIVKKGEVINKAKARAIDQANPEKIYLRSVLRCQAKRGVCRKCYGYDLGYNQLVNKGAPVGIVAAQSIGEPGTQLTLRTFHIGGIAGKDITQGLPRAEEIFEHRSPKIKALMAEHKGRVSIEKKGRNRILKIKYHGQQEEEHPIKDDWEIKVKQGERIKARTVLAELANKKIRAKHAGQVKLEKDSIKIKYFEEGIEEYPLAKNENVYVTNNQVVEPGQQLTEGSLDLYKLFSLKGQAAVENYMLREIINVYLSQGVKIDARHFEIIIRQMFSRCLIIDSKGTNLLLGTIVSRNYKKECDKIAMKQGKEPSKAKELFLGITKSALNCDSWLAAASFQETARILIAEAITGRLDYLRGLKENVIIGRLIPAGTGYKEMQK